MAGYHTVLVYLIIFLLLPCILSENILGKQDDEFDFDGLPGSFHEFKFEVAGGGYECFFQKINRNVSLYVSFRIMKGADKNVDFIIRQPDGKTLESHKWTNEGSTEKLITMEGVYEFCVDNANSRYATKLVYMVIYTHEEAKWEKYAQELQDLNLSIGNSTSSIQNVDRNINKMTEFLVYSRSHVMADYYTITYNNSLVQNWSIMMCIVVIATSSLQTYFVRSLFSTRNVTSGAKPRA